MEPNAVHIIRRPEPLRWLILIAIAALVVVTLSLAFQAFADAPFVSLTAFAFAGGLGWFGVALWRTPAREVSFDGERLFDDAGEELCLLEEIEQIERGFAIFKPSSGFALVLKTARPNGWSPGLWWRIGRRVGVGGATPGRAGRNMADAITTAAAMRALSQNDE